MTEKERLHALLDLFDARALSDAESAELKQLLSRPELRRTLVNRARLEASIIERTQHWAAEERAASGFQAAASPDLWASLYQRVHELVTPRAIAWSASVAALFVVCGIGWLAARPSARLANISGTVHVQRGEQSIAGHNGLALRHGDVIHTAQAGAATVKWLDEATTVRVHSGAELELISLTKGKKLALRSGLVSANVAKQVSGQPLLLTTPNARAEVLGTRFRLKSEPAQTRLDVTTGRVQLSRGDDGNGIIVERLQSGLVPPSGEVQVKSQPPHETLQEGILAHWKMDVGEDERSIPDASGQDHALHLLAGANVAPDRGGSVLVFTKKDAKAQCAGLALPSRFTCALWLRMDEPLTPGGLEPLVANTPAGISQHGFRFFLTKLSDTGERSLYFETGNGVTGAQARSAPLELKPATWHHLALTVDRDAGRCVIYCDGANITSVSGIRSDFALDRTLVLGQMPTSYRHKLNGALDEVRIYGRMLTANEIRALARP
jgi:hypothetical protein